MQKFMVTMLLLVVCIGFGFAQESTPDSVEIAPELRADIIKLMEMTGSGDLALQMMSAMLVQFKQMLPHVPEIFWDESMNEVKASELIDLVIPIYAKYFTHEDIKGLIEFYKTPLGKKFVASSPQILAESMEAGQEWGKQIGIKVTAKLKAEGY